VGTARLRISTHSYNSEEAVRTLITKLATADSLRETKIPTTGRATSSTTSRRSPTLVVTGTDTDVGKTVVSALLVKAAARRGPAIYWKPVQTGDDSDTETLRRLVQTANCEFSTPCYEFPLPASPHAAAADVGKSIQMPFLDQALRKERTRHTEARLIVELAGGLLVPLTSEVTQLDWLAGHRLPHVLVARSGLGTLNHTLLSLEALRGRGIFPEALFLVGRRHPSNRATLEQMAGVPLIYELPLLETLSGEALDEWLDENDLAALLARGLNPERSENFA
ncbi:MAG: dethiobiotin synthase, partial [Planctomycetota bacterium]